MTQPVVDALLVGDSAPMRELKALIHKLAAVDLTVLIEGETGTGKELVAQALHDGSGRPGRFVPVNVCAIPDTMFEATLFGHVRGAFTGAATSAPGLIAEADRGTLLLDEVGSLPLPLQAKLLRTVETGVYRPIGAGRDMTSRFRLIASTNESLQELAARGLFRRDLEYRLRAATIRCPPLRERLEDLPLLVQHFVAELNGHGRSFAPAAVAELGELEWLGNVRELRSAVHRMCVLADTDVICSADVRRLRTVSLGTGERQRLIALLTSLGWDSTQAARAEGVHRATLYRRMRALGISRRRDSCGPEP